MRNLSEIIEDCKLNGRPDYEELRYSVLVMTGVLNMVNHELIKPRHLILFDLTFSKQS